jgi:hypothetical protein
MFSNYGYFRTGSDQYGAIASESTTEVGKSKEEYNVRNCKSENPAAAEKVDVLYRLERKNNRDVVVVWR